MSTQGRRHYSSPNIVLEAPKSARPGAPTIKEEEEETIVLSRSDGVHHDIVSVFANPGIANMINTSSQRVRSMSVDESVSNKEAEHDKEPSTISITRSDGLSHDIVKVFRTGGNDSSRSSKAPSLNEILVHTNINTSGRASSVDIPAPANPPPPATIGERIKAGRASTFAKIADLLTGKARTDKPVDDNAHAVAPTRRSFTNVPGVPPGNISAHTLHSVPSIRMQNEFFMKSVRIVHMSDTHNLLRATSRSRFLPNGNIFVHTGNFTCFGKEEEFLQFNSWLESVADVYHYRIVILGHKDVKFFGGNFEAMKKLLPGATHVLCHEEVTVLGIRFYGAPWNFQHRKNYTIRFGAPSSTSGQFDNIPQNVHVLLTHGPAYGRLDSHFAGDTKEHWGSRELAESVRRARPQVHMHGHVKDCKGVIPAFGNYPLVVNGCVTNVDGNLIWAAPTVIKATQVMLDSSTNTVSWAFSLDSIDE